MGDILKTTKRRLYNNIIPSGYYTPFKRVWNAVVKNIPEEVDDPMWGHVKRNPNQTNAKDSHLLTNYESLQEDNPHAFNKDLENDIRNALWAKYLGLTDEQVGFKISDYIEESPYRPPHAKEGEIFYRINPKKYPLINDGQSTVEVIPNKQKVANKYKLNASGLQKWFMPDSVEINAYPKNKFGGDVTVTKLKDLPEGYLALDGGFGMGTYTVGRGEDENGEYVSYYDEWNINPFKGKSAGITIPGVSSIEDISILGTPIKLYDRRYESLEKKQQGGPIKPNFIQRLEDRKKFRNFRMTLPKNLRPLSRDYNMRRYWELHGKPDGFYEALTERDGMFSWESDGAFHANTVAPLNEKGEGEFMKSKNHRSLFHEVDWYNKGITYDDNGNPQPLTGEDRKVWENFRKQYDLDTSKRFYKYVPKTNLK